MLVLRSIEEGVDGSPTGDVVLAYGASGSGFLEACDTRPSVLWRGLTDSGVTDGLRRLRREAYGEGVRYLQNHVTRV